MNPDPAELLDAGVGLADLLGYAGQLLDHLHGLDGAVLVAADLRASSVAPARRASCLAALLNASPQPSSQLATSPPRLNPKSATPRT